MLNRLGGGGGGDEKEIRLSKFLGQIREIAKRYNSRFNYVMDCS